MDYRAERHCALDDCCLSASKCKMVLWFEAKIGLSKYKHSFWQTLHISRKHTNLTREPDGGSLKLYGCLSATGKLKAANFMKILNKGTENWEKIYYVTG